ncbi:hypothetical protein B5F98_09290 [Pseudoflavonifractor sp. An44]|uniref:glycosyltransferase family 2 protein n=1 Tax=Pseudoflavonifractor sp. An44 TaxID=1965635 RepID=UPI000B39193F|nr:glycosyltransferase family A protein [Pseudoflavonifractor sp. An44]OUN95451.1 hypothetical protein B5F98_09290 [Pseudoflavonifractor sp. An44]
MVSVLIPAYNAEKTICRCLNSVLSQTFHDFEVIVVNDGSKDTTLSMIRGYSEKDARVKVVDQPNQGVATARNVALEHACGEYILYVDADDWIEPNMLERLLELSDDADIVFCGNDNADTPREKKEIGVVAIEYWDQHQQMLEFMKHRRMTGMLWNKLLRRSTTQGCRFNEKTGYGEDAEFLWQVLKKSKKMVVTSEILYHHTLDEHSISHRSFSAQKYSAIPMWEGIVEEVTVKFPELVPLAKERLMCAAVYSLYEARCCGYNNQYYMKHMRNVVRKQICKFVMSKKISIKFKIYALAACLGY